MKHLLCLLLLMLALPLMGGEGQAPAREGEGRSRVAPATLEVGGQLNLYSYSYLGVEVRAFTEKEFSEYRRRLAPVPSREGGTTMVPGQPAYLRTRMGILVTRVLADSPADKAGLEVGDVIVIISGSRMESPVDLLTVLRNCGPGCTMHMMCIGRDLHWKYVMPVPEDRAVPAHVGHIIPRLLSRENQWKMQKHQARAIELLAGNPVPIKEACDELEAICRLIYSGFTPGCLQIPLRTGDGCTITATRYGWNIDVKMVENGVETAGVLKRWVWEVPGKPFSPSRPGPDVLPEAIRRRLQETDTTPPLPPSRWDEL